MNRNSGLRSALAAIGALCVSSLAVADSEQTTRPVIRGTGNDVTIVYQSEMHPKKPAKAWTAPAPAAASENAPAADDPLVKAVQMKSSGASDQSVIAFLQKNEVDMPDVVDADMLRDLRKAGAGDAVISLVSRYSAIDIGETAESAGAPVPQYYDPQAQEAYTGAFPDLANLGYPFYGGGGYGGGYGGGVWWGGRFNRFGPKVSPHGNVNVFVRSGHGFFPKSRPLPTRFPQRMTMSRISGGPAAHGMMGSSGAGGGHRTR
jgi:hypothetical protein